MKITHILKIGLVFGLLSINPVDAKTEVTLPSFAPLAKSLQSAVVNISTTQFLSPERRLRLFGLPPLPPGHPLEGLLREFVDSPQFGNQLKKATALGSGFVIDPDGYVVTNNHVVAEAEEIKVILTDGTELKAEVIGKDSKTDLALLKVKTSKKMPFVEWGDSAKAQVGDWILSIGNPFGLGGSVTNGIISGRSRDIGLYAAPGMEMVDYVDDFIQTNAVIEVGSSGGPLFNMDGKVIGINTILLSGPGNSFGFAIPSNLAKTVIDQFKEFGHTKRGILGVKVQKVTEEIAEEFGLSNKKGALVAEVIEESPAAAIALKKGDIIIKINNQAVEDSIKLPRIVGESPIGKPLPLVIWRGGKEISLQVTLLENKVVEEESEKAELEKEAAQPSLFGMKLSPITPKLKKQCGLDPTATGVVITHLDYNSLASEKGVRVCDLILQAGKNTLSEKVTPLKTPEELLKIVSKEKSGKKKTVLFLMQRQEAQFYIALKDEKK